MSCNFLYVTECFSEHSFFRQEAAWVLLGRAPSAADTPQDWLQLEELVWLAPALSSAAEHRAAGHR